MPVETVAELLAAGHVAPLVLRMLLVGSFVVLVATLAERTGPFVGAMVASLPLSAGPIYVLLALEHDADWLQQAMLGSVAVCGATPIFILAYCALAQRCGAIMSVGGALLAWSVCATFVQARPWTLPEALATALASNGVSILVGRQFTTTGAQVRAARRVSDLAIRALLCAALAGLVIGLSNAVPPRLSGVLSITPIMLTSIAVVLHARVGGPQTAALLAHSLSGLVGMISAFAVAQASLAALGVWPALGAGLAVTVGWNLLLIAARLWWRRP